MDKSQLQAVLARINAAPIGGEVPLTVEDAGLLHAFVTVRQRAGDLSARERALLNRVIGVLKAWKQPGETDEGSQRRQQMLLRKAIDKAQQNLWPAMHADEVALLQSTRQMLDGLVSKSKGNERLLALLNDLLKRYDDYQLRESTAQSAAAHQQPGV